MQIATISSANGGKIRNLADIGPTVPPLIISLFTQLSLSLSVLGDVGGGVFSACGVSVKEDKVESDVVEDSFVRFEYCGELACLFLKYFSHVISRPLNVIIFKNGFSISS
jgi:hypothetical protein